MPTIPSASLRSRGRRPLALTAAGAVVTAGLLTGCGSTPSTVPGLGGLTVCQSAASG